MLKRIIVISQVLLMLFNPIYYKKTNIKYVLWQIQNIGNNSLAIILLTGFFVGMVFSLQLIKELIYLNATNLVGSILTISFIRELSPILTSIIIIGRVGSCFTSELASMYITEQIDVLYILGIDPLIYLVLPRVYACVLILPILTILSFVTSLFSSAYLCFFLYNIDSTIFFNAAISCLYSIDIIKSSLKSCIFGLIISLISCSWGLSANSSSKDVGVSTTSSVVTSLILVLIIDFILSYFMFNNVEETFKLL
uniref:ABC transporter permease n=1 Tax=Centroceras clavulatum TaxID=159503 RepID=A0A4D6WPL7_9FLOR|nr:hypothetical protein [Centroceras clavulatum]